MARRRCPVRVAAGSCCGCSGRRAHRDRPRYPRGFDRVPPQCRDIGVAEMGSRARAAVTDPADITIGLCGQHASCWPRRLRHDGRPPVQPCRESMSRASPSTISEHGMAASPGQPMDHALVTSAPDRRARARINRSQSNGLRLSLLHLVKRELLSISPPSPHLQRVRLKPAAAKLLFLCR